MSDFTPGPWETEDLPLNILARDEQGNPFPVAKVRGWGHIAERYGKDRAVAIMKANARAIAAVPEMVGLLNASLMMFIKYLRDNPEVAPLMKNITGVLKRIDGQD